MRSPKNHSLISFVFEINQTIQTTNHQRPCTTTQEIKKAHSNCQSFSCPDLVSFPALSQIDPQIPLLVCHSVNFFKFRSCDYTPPRTQKLSVSFESWENLEKRFPPNPLSVSFTVRTTMVSNHFRSPNFRSSLTDV